MVGSLHHPFADLAARGRPFWLPPAGWGNGLDADTWIAIIDVRGELPATLLLLELRDAGVPGYAAVIRRPHVLGAGRSGAGPLTVRIWVGGEAYGRGESVVLRAMPGLVDQFGPSLLD